MKLITIRSQILEVAYKWKQQYWSDNKPDKMEILKKLEELNKETATAEDVENIIGNTSWAEPEECKECRKYYDAVVELGDEPDGDEPDYESSTTWICSGCLKKATVLLKKELNK